MFIADVSMVQSILVPALPRDKDDQDSALRQINLQYLSVLENLKRKLLYNSMEKYMKDYSVYDRGVYFGRKSTTLLGFDSHFFLLLLPCFPK